MAVQTQRRCGLSNHDLFVNSILVGGRLSSVRIPQNLKETDCLLTLMILYARRILQCSKRSCDLLLTLMHVSDGEHV